uniref:Uncharacterized protein LOC105032532 n=1 Tax=Elaeis guineensis var. tenera TaxID=51953 RepID=A0A8N4EX70_ELAGV|nr:uncharacterized protein LOC105032532 [Elaeis guineensis]
MKLVWCSEIASKAYIDVVKVLADRELKETNVAELAWEHDDGAATSLGLEAAARHTRGQHVCIVPNKRLAAEYEEVMRRAGLLLVEWGVVVGEGEEVMGELEGVDFMVVEWQSRDAAKVLRVGSRGMVVVRKGAGRRRSRTAVMAVGTRLMRSGGGAGGTTVRGGGRGVGVWRAGKIVVVHIVAANSLVV